MNLLACRKNASRKSVRLSRVGGIPRRPSFHIGIAADNHRHRSAERLGLTRHETTIYTLPTSTEFPIPYNASARACVLLAETIRYQRSRQEVCKWTSGGGLLGGWNSGDFDAIDVTHATIHVATLLRRVEFAKAFFGDTQQAPDNRRGTLDFLEALRGAGA